MGTRSEMRAIKEQFKVQGLPCEIILQAKLLRISQGEKFKV